MEKPSVNRWYPWLTDHYRNLVNYYSLHHAHHCVLLHAPVICGAEQLAYALGRWFLCQHPQEEKTCGQCHGCQLMIASTHPDWHQLTPDNNRTQVSVEQVRLLSETLSHSAQQGGNKVVWLPQAERLSDAAANALLKTLEEPQENTYFLLGCHDISLLLATIRSRSMTWLLTLPDETYCVEWLSRQLSEDRTVLTIALRLNAMSPVETLTFFQQDNWLKRMKFCQQFTTAISQHNILMLLADCYSEPIQARLVWGMTLWIDALKYQQQLFSHLINEDQLPLVTTLANKIPSSVLHTIYRQWAECRHQLQTISGINTELLLTNLLCQTQQLLFTSF